MLILLIEFKIYLVSSDMQFSFNLGVRFTGFYDGQLTLVGHKRLHSSFILNPCTFTSKENTRLPNGFMCKVMNHNTSHHQGQNSISSYCVEKCVSLLAEGKWVF